MTEATRQELPDMARPPCPLCGIGLDPGQIVCSSHRHAIHLGTLTAGEIVRVYAAGAYGEKGKEVNKPVLELSTGDAFLLVPMAFRPLSPMEWMLFEAARDAIARFFRELVTAGRLGGATPNECSLMFRAALTAQLRALAPREPPPDAG